MILTQHLHADHAGDSERASELLRAGRLVAIPTETVYGLAANALDTTAVERIFAAKKRPHWDPLIVHISDDVMLVRVVRDVSSTARTLMDTFWPGPLTLLLPRHPDLPPAVTAGRDLVGVRMPAHPAALALIQSAGLPLAAPSANRFGHVSPTTAEHVLADLDGRIDAVLDAGPCSIGVESTVFDPAQGVIYRYGGVSAADLARVTGQPVRGYSPPDVKRGAEPASLPSPGAGIRHYAPRARLVLVKSEPEFQVCVREFVPETIGIMLPDDWQLPGFMGSVYRWSEWHNTAALAQTLYEGLRFLDAKGVDVIVCPLPPEHGPLSQAIHDRLQKGAKV